MSFSFLNVLCGSKRYTFGDSDLFTLLNSFRDSFGDTEDSCLIPLQEKYSSTHCPSLPSNRNEKSHMVSCSDSAGSSSCTTPSTTTNVKLSNPVKKVSHHTSPPTTKELAYLDQRTSSTRPQTSYTRQKETGGPDSVLSNVPHTCTAGATSVGPKRESHGQTIQCKEVSSIDNLSQPLKMRVPRAPRGAHHMYSAASSSNSSLSSSISDPQRGSTSSNVRKRNYIIFDENDEDTLI